MSDYTDLHNHNCEECGKKYKVFPSDEHSRYCPNCRGIRKEEWMAAVQTAVEQQSETMNKLLNFMKEEFSR